MSAAMKSFPPSLAERVIQAFGGSTRLARALGHRSASTVDSWRRAGRIPHWRRDEIAAAAASEGVRLPPDFVDARRAA
jgi:hypothetical protein